jgi:hypothetical protein
MARVHNFCAGPGGAARGGAGARRGGDARLAWQRHVLHGDEPPVQGRGGRRRGGRGVPAPPAAYPTSLRCCSRRAAPARSSPPCRSTSRAARRPSITQHGAVVAQGHEGSLALRRGQGGGGERPSGRRSSAAAGRLGTARGRRLPALHAQRDHRRRRVSLGARGRVPLVADMSSTLLSRPSPVDRYDVIYAGAQKNIGPAGLTLLIVRRALYGRALDICPAMLNWQALDEAGSMLNTPPTYSIYLAGLVFAWLEEQGGLAAMGARNRAKAEPCTRPSMAVISTPTRCTPESRSWMNVPFTLADPALDAASWSEAATRGLLNLKRASLRRRHARQYLQRHGPGSGRGRADRLHAAISSRNTAENGSGGGDGG